ncbi:MAG: class I SAM-dependent methyltransferase, partial [Solirubrobacterales bacterium]
MDGNTPIADAYLEDLAFVHDDSFGFIATGAAKTLAAKLTERGFSSGLVIELACGSGISSALLMSAGYDVLGYDISEP